MNTKGPIEKGLRIILGLFLILYALNQFLHLVPTSYGTMPDYAEDFINAVAIYLPALYIFEIIIGLMLVIDKWSPFILIILFPLSVAFLIFMYANSDFSDAWPALVVSLLNIILLVYEKEKYQPLFK